VPSNLPVQLTGFVGRDREIAQLQQLLEDVRLLTLVGAGGVGKTRLALRVAGDLVGQEPDGVWLVELAALQDPSLVPQAVAGILGVRERADEPLAVTLGEVLRSQHLLLVLDNCEHLIGACAELVEYLLRKCTSLRVLTTGRQPLGLAGETTWRVPSLAVLDASSRSGIDEIAASEAVRLFLERARSALPGFTLTDRNAAPVAQLCRRLDGIPLAIELAAARTRALGVEQIVARLDDRFRLLGDAGPRTPARQRTLRATVEWSHDLLSEVERVLFRRLAVFAGGWSLEAAESVCSVEPLATDEVMDRLARLVDQSLVIAEGQETVVRYRLLETLRQYAAERLDAADEQASLRDRHLAWYLALAERAEAAFNGPAQATWLDVLEGEHDNVRAALRWCLDSGAIDQAFRLSTAYAYFWEVRGHRYRTEGRRWLEEALAADHSLVGTPGRASALYWAGTFASEQFDFQRALVLLEESLRVWQALGERRGLAEALLGLGVVAREQGRYTEAESLLTRSLNLARGLGDQLMLVWTLRNLGAVAQAQGNIQHALELTTESLTSCQALGDNHQTGHLLDQLGQLKCQAGQFIAAADAHQRAAAMLSAAGCEEGVNTSRFRQARLAQARGDDSRARSLAVETLLNYRVVGNRRDVPACLDLVAQIVVNARPERAARLLGAAQALRESMAVVLSPADQPARDQALAVARQALGEGAFESAWLAARAGGSDEAIDLAVSLAEVVEVAAPADSALTARERQVVLLVGRGHSNREIADTLVVSVRTAEAHVTNVLNKLNLRSRAQLAVWASEHGLLV
jgi:predicted ATPase/DNA-binding CsgD family transcriptional regulator